MAAANSIPRFREKSYKGKNGKTLTYYVYDMRGKGQKDIRLGSDRENALIRYAQCTGGTVLKPRKPVPFRLPPKIKGARRNLGSDYWLEQPSWVRRMFYNAERRSKLNGRIFTLSPYEFLEVIKRAANHCEISGIEFDTTLKSGPFSPSLDRISNAKGYEPDNIRIVCYVANVAMNTWGMEPVLRLAKAVYAPTANNSMRANALNFLDASKNIAA